MKNRKLVFAFILSTMLSLLAGLLSDLAASYLAPNLATRPWLVYGTLIATFIISLSISVYLFLRSPIDESATQSVSSVDVPDLDSKPKIDSNLPARGEFIGREKEKERVLEGLKSNYPFVVIQGPAGIGKTALAREVSWIVKEKSATKNGDTPHFEAIVWTEDYR
ncbi:MAG: hypothetical protein KAX26_15230 [Anaerolineae bacterium]|nr:hypothetical protein [Anaerolineae bacterium]